jgi:hypothetical protein
VRPTGGFRFVEFRRKLLKWVRPNHVRTQAHWTRQIRRNGFASDQRSAISDQLSDPLKVVHGEPAGGA